MYLKSIEVQGFKSFANKIVFDFHNGITGIVGPNGSGKSNVADAVRWVLGEQKIKQLRGDSMQDVIFSGTQNRKALSYAYVAITLDNSDHQLAIDYTEVTVARRIYRSGESEYLINGTICRLRDINELFYDTGIGKEGYSIIGQGQIDRILSSKPEESRELFDEATGIVKFKRRKKNAEKKLDDEKQNLVRVNDILVELEKQIGPLEKQSEIAKQYLSKKEELKIFDINMFLMEVDRVQKQLKQVEEHQTILTVEMDETTTSYEELKHKYGQTEEELESLNEKIETSRSEITNSSIEKQKLEGQIEVLREQIHSVHTNAEHVEIRLNQILAELAEKELLAKGFTDEHVNFKESLNKIEESAVIDREKLAEAQKLTAEHLSTIADTKGALIELLNERASTKGKMQHFDTMQDQIQIRKVELNQRLLTNKSEESKQEGLLEEYRAEFEGVNSAIVEINAQKAKLEQALGDLKEEIAKKSEELEQQQASFHKNKSKLDALKNMTERYDGYGNSIRKIMEKKESNAGILGVVADIIKVEKKFEIAIETALGGNIQNIVTDTEETAKSMISYLKENRFGRATFLPVSMMRSQDNFPKKDALLEKGALGLANTLVEADSQYEGVIRHLLGRVLVVDCIDSALAIARKYKQSIHIVTLEGEYLSPGGSMTGGSFRNNSNLLGRRREVEELEDSIKVLEEKIGMLSDSLDSCRNHRSETRKESEQLYEELQQKYLQQNTIKMNVDLALQEKEKIQEAYQQLQSELYEIDLQVKEISSKKEEIQEELLKSESEEKENEEATTKAQESLELLKVQEESIKKQMEEVHLEIASIQQKMEFSKENQERIQGEVERLELEKAQLLQNNQKNQLDVTVKEEEILRLTKEIEDHLKQVQESEIVTKELTEKKEQLIVNQKDFLEKREKLSEEKNRLDKELFRLNSQKEKLEEYAESQTNYMWAEYELSYNTALPIRNEAYTDASSLKRNIYALKDEIRKLGSVNVNAIEDFKNVSERYEFMSGQRDDIVTAENTLLGIIEELDAGMRKQFQERFEVIRVEFDKAFKELFGGGQGSLEINQDADILEAGIRIIAQPPGKKLQNMMQLSGGEKALTAISLLFAIQNLKPSPFCLLDEIEAALDDSNVGRFSKYLHKLTKNTQFIIITHRKGTMEAADRLYGITMQEKGISALVSVNLIEEDLDK